MMRARFAGSTFPRLTADDLRRYEQVLDTMMPHDAQMKIVWRRDPAHHDSLGDVPARLPTTLILDRQGKVVRQIPVGKSPHGVWTLDHVGRL